MLLGASLWAGRLVFGATPWEPWAASLLAVALLLAEAVNVVAMLLSPGRWVRNSIVCLAGIRAVTAIVLPMDPLWVGALLATAAGVAISRVPSLDLWFHQTKPDRVPARATMLALGLVWLPGFTAAFAIPRLTPAGWAMAVFGLVAGWAYARALPGALWTIRPALPILGILSAAGLHLGAAAGVLAVTSVLTFLAWTADARLAASRPVPRRAASIPVHPELAPPGLLEAAGYDRWGRPLPRKE